MNFITLGGKVYNADHILQVSCAANGVTLHFINKTEAYISNFETEEDCKYYFEQLQKQLTGFVGDRSVEWREHAKRKRETLTAAEKEI